MDATHDIAQRVFGTRSRVRVLRVLDGVGVPLNVSQVARATGLTKPAASKALEDLAELGLVGSTRAGRSWVHWLVRDNYFVEHMVAPVFEAEARLADEIEATLKDLFAHRAASVILFGSRARGDADAQSDVDVLLVGTDEAAKVALEDVALKSASDFRDRFGATLSPLVYTQDEAASLGDLAPALYESIATDGLVLDGLAPDQWETS